MSSEGNMKALRFAVSAALVFAMLPVDSGEAGPALGRISVVTDSFTFCLGRTGRWHSTIDLPDGGSIHYESTASDKNKVNIDRATGRFKDTSFFAHSNAATGAVSGKFKGANKYGVVKITASLGSAPDPVATVTHTLKFKPVVYLDEDCV